MASIKNKHSMSSSLFILLVCLAGVILAQTFQYSRGWTNGKKRAGGSVPRVFQETEAPDVLGVCQMLRLKEIMAQKPKRDQVILPCEILGEPEDEIVERFRRNVAKNEAPAFEAQKEEIHS